MPSRYRKENWYIWKEGFQLEMSLNPVIILKRCVRDCFKSISTLYQQKNLTDWYCSVLLGIFSNSDLSRTIDGFCVVNVYWTDNDYCIAAREIPLFVHFLLLFCNKKQSVNVCWLKKLKHRRRTFTRRLCQCGKHKDT